MIFKVPGYIAANVQSELCALPAVAHRQSDLSNQSVVMDQYQSYEVIFFKITNFQQKLSYFKFVGRVVAKAIYDNKLLECYFTRAFYKHILGVMVTYKDMESEDYSLYQSLVYMLNNPVADLGYEVCTLKWRYSFK